MIVGSDWSGMPMRSRFQKTDAMTGRSSGSPVSFSMTDARVTTWRASRSSFAAFARRVSSKTRSNCWTRRPGDLGRLDLPGKPVRGGIQVPFEALRLRIEIGDEGSVLENGTDGAELRELPRCEELRGLEESQSLRDGDGEGVRISGEKFFENAESGERLREPVLAGLHGFSLRPRSAARGGTGGGRE